MLIALLTDIHGNREAFSACLDHARLIGADRYILLGDYVGYGADPAWAVDTVASLVNEGAVAPLGNSEIPLLATRTWLAVIGAVGQPRDGVPAANYAVFDSGRQQLRYLRVPYDNAKAARKVREAGLPEKLALRLEQGR